MTAELLDFTSNEQLAESVGDAALAALLRGKPADESIPTAVWWYVAETLRTSVTIRRTVASGLAPDLEDLPMLIAEATLLAEAAMADLTEATGARPTPVAAGSDLHYLSGSSGLPASSALSSSPQARPAFGLQLSVLFLARLLVTQRPTAPQRLANTLAAHLRALAQVEAGVPVTQPGGPARRTTMTSSAPAISLAARR